MFLGPEQRLPRSKDGNGLWWGQDSSQIIPVNANSLDLSRKDLRFSKIGQLRGFVLVEYGKTWCAPMFTCMRVYAPKCNLQSPMNHVLAYGRRGRCCAYRSARFYSHATAPVSCAAYEASLMPFSSVLHPNYFMRRSNNRHHG